MFGLTDQDLSLNVLDFPAGISCFAAEMHELGHNNVISADRYYDLSPMDMVKHVDFVIQDLSERVDQHIKKLHTDAEQEIENLTNVWNQYAQTFLADYSVGQQEGRYQAASLPRLPFEDRQFDLALCSDMIFHNPDIDTEVAAMELMRVAKEVRVFPLLDHAGETSKEIGPLMLSLQQKNLGVEVKEVPYNLQKKSNAMLRIWANECVVS